MKNVLVSVVMPTHNYGCFIGQSIESLLKQTYPHFELIIVDDASTDHTVDVIDGYDDERIVLVKRETCSGSGVFARNDGLAIAKGALIATADGDDVYVCNRLERQVRFLEAHPDIDILGGSMMHVDREGKRIAKYSRSLILERPESYREALLRGVSVVYHTTMMFRRRILEKVAGYNNYASAGDLEFLIRASRYFQFYNLEDVLVYRRLHEASVTRTCGVRLNAYYRQIFMAKEYLWLMEEIERLERSGNLE